MNYFFNRARNNQDCDHRQFKVTSEDNLDFCSNYVNTARYSFLSFFPLFICDQFGKLTNVYFLIIGLMEQIPGVSPVGRFVTLVPLSLVLFVSAIKEIVEDIKRRKSDIRMNSLKCEVFSRFWNRSTWGEITVGDIVRVSAGQTFPADLILIATSESSQCCYIQTASLDGETNNKIKQCKDECKNYFNEDHWSSISAVVKCEPPNNNLYKFAGTITLNDNISFPIDNDSLVLRGSQLKNTHWAVGIATYTGHETKIMLNSSNIIIKRSSIDHATNWLVLGLMAILLVLTIVCASLSEIYQRELAINHWYLGFAKSTGFTFHLSCITFFIAYHNIIPISLLVTLEIINVIQSYVISYDPQMYSKTSQTNAIVKTSSIIEELGHVNYIFTDKTGTLTCNEMVLLEISIGTQSYKLGADNTSDIELILAFSRTDEVTFKMFIINLLLCNAVIPEYGRNKNDVAYQSSSPDETAIINALAQHDYKFIERTHGGIKIEYKGMVEFWKILAVIDFTSDRKRMSVIAQSQNDQFYLFTKGADSVILERLKVRDDIIFESTLNYLESFAKNGLRTLCIAYKQLLREECQIILSDIESAYSQINDREIAIDQAIDHVETNLILLGTTGIEDKLQINVPETINNLKNANIKIWMLTGDKLETALNIGYSCHILNSEMDIRVMSCSSVEDCKSKLQHIQQEKNIQATFQGKLRINPMLRMNLAFIISGQDLSFAMDPECIELFLDIVIYCESVICCRASPLQKKNVLLLIKERVSETTTLAIGDGANDCSMIRAANVGIGIIGKEGMQAANTADFAIGEFSHLTRLLFVHGAASYRRNCNTIHFCFYKNIVLNLLPFYFNFYDMFSSQIIFSKVHITLYNVFYSSLPPFCFGLLDQSCSLEAQYNVPYLYESIRRSSPFSIKRFYAWLLNGVLHSSLIFFLCYALCRRGVINIDGNPISSALFGNVVFTLTLIVITLKAALELRYWFWMTHVGICGGFFSYIVFMSIFSRRLPPLIWFEPEFLDSDILMYESPLFWLGLGIPIIVMLPDFIFHCIRNTWFTPSYMFVTELERLRQINWNEPDNIKTIQSELDRSSELKSRRTKKYFGFAFSMTENVFLKNFLPRYPFRQIQ